MSENKPDPQTATSPYTMNTEELVKVIQTKIRRLQALEAQNRRQRIFQSLITALIVITIICCVIASAWYVHAGNTPAGAGFITATTLGAYIFAERAFT